MKLLCQANKINNSKTPVSIFVKVKVLHFLP